MYIIMYSLNTDACKNWYHYVDVAVVVALFLLLSTSDAQSNYICIIHVSLLMKRECVLWNKH